MNKPAKITGWPGLKYVPVFPVVMRIFRRKHRDGRKRMMRFFLEHGMSDLYVRAKALHDDPSLNGSVKMKIYQGIENDYIKLVTAGTPSGAPASVPETNDPQAAGSAGVELQREESIPDGPGTDAGDGVSGLAYEIAGE